ncbi:MAG: D-glycero-beta-D-manno-heptose 1-phosphate adenylyltransferase [Phycisphaerae bacterium]|nr:D-glycero-beta-D-manno-heptose 1-phosphate adenylyltransferase [Phycisphaerae bacterium]
MSERLIEIMENAGASRVLLVGDFMLDNYLFGNIDRISPEAPVPVMNVTGRQCTPGGAGSVAADLSALNCQVQCLGVVGSDAIGAELTEMLTELAGVNVDGFVVDPKRPTTSKQRVVGLAQHRHRQQLMRIDDECSNDISIAVRAELKEKFVELLSWCDVVCLEDYNKGVLCVDFAQSIIELANAAGKKVVVDPASTNQYERYNGTWLVKPNRRELGIATDITIENEQSAKEACVKLTQMYEIDNVVVTLDKSGAYYYCAAKQEGRLVPTRPRSVYDVTGAGDMVLATLGMLIGGSYGDVDKPDMNEIVQLANVAGGLEVERFGCVGITRSEIITELSQQTVGHNGKLRESATLCQELDWHRQQGKKIVFSNGCFDILHPGHVTLLDFCKKQGDILIVGLNSDSSVQALKGPKRPILNQQSRATMLGALEMVDYVVIFNEETPKEIIEMITPDVLIKGTDWTGDVVGQDWVESHGGKVVLMPLVEGVSTTNIVDEIVNKYGAEK